MGMFQQQLRLIASTDFRRLTMVSGNSRESDPIAVWAAFKSFAASSTTARSSGGRLGLFPSNIESNKSNRTATELR